MQGRRKCLHSHVILSEGSWMRLFTHYSLSEWNVLMVNVQRADWGLLLLLLTLIPLLLESSYISAASVQLWPWWLGQYETQLLLPCLWKCTHTLMYMRPKSVSAHTWFTIIISIQIHTEQKLTAGELWLYSGTRVHSPVNNKMDNPCCRYEYAVYEYRIYCTLLRSAVKAVTWNLWLRNKAWGTDHLSDGHNEQALSFVNTTFRLAPSSWLLSDSRLGSGIWSSD